MDRGRVGPNFPRSSVPAALANVLSEIALHEKLRQSENESVRQAETSRRGQDVQLEAERMREAAAMNRLTQQIAAAAEENRLKQEFTKGLHEKDMMTGQMLQDLIAGNPDPAARYPSSALTALATMRGQDLRNEIAEMKASMGREFAPRFSFIPGVDAEGRPSMLVGNQRTGEVAPAPGIGPKPGADTAARERNALMGRIIQKWGPLAREYRGIIPFDKLDPAAAQDFAADAQSVGMSPFPVKPPSGGWFSGPDPTKVQAFKSLPAPPVAGRGGNAPQQTKTPTDARGMPTAKGYVGQQQGTPFDRGTYGRNKQTGQMGWYKNGVFTPE